MFLGFFNTACAVEKSKLPKEMPYGVEIRFNSNYGGSPAYKTIVIKTSELSFEAREYVPERKTFEMTKWTAKISGEDLAKLYQVFLENNFDVIENDERQGITYDAPSEGVFIGFNEKVSFQQSYGDNQPMSGKNLRRYQAVKLAIFNLVAKYADSNFVTSYSNGWVKIGGATKVAGGSVFNGIGWVSAKMIAVSAKGEDDYDAPSPLYEKTSKSSKKVGAIPSGTTTMQIVGYHCFGLKVIYKGKTGWLSAGNICGSPVTNCS